MPQAFPDPRRLLDWYDRHHRTLPWRAPPGRLGDPYRVWLSEIMLQQTTVQTVVPYFLTFLERWPTVQALAAADLDDVLTRWAGLGYYARARNLHRCAKAVAAQGGVFPDDEAYLLALPGIGVYTAAAIAAIAFGRKATVVDGNVERVMARLFAITDPLPGVKPRLKERAAELTPAERPGDYAQAVMDLGATICTPRSPACALCPWRDPCQARRQGIAADLPAKTAKPVRPTRHGVAFWITGPDGAALLRRRPESGLLGGMMEIPSTPWRETPWGLEEALAFAPTRTRWTALPGSVIHVFTHFRLEMTVLRGRVPNADPDLGTWCPVERLGDQALPTIMRKLARHARSES